MTKPGPWAEAVAIKDGQFVYVGENAGTEDFIGPGTEINDLGGAFVMPGIFNKAAGQHNRGLEHILVADIS